jgi:hypothetical protein
MGKTTRVDPRPALKKFKNDISKHDELLKFYIDLNLNVMNELFFGSVLREDNVMKRQRDFVVGKCPMFLGQIALLYKYNPGKYLGMLSEEFLNFLAKHFRKNVVFIINHEGFLQYIMIMQITRKEKIMLNKFLAENIDDIERFQYLSSEYDPKLDYFKLLIAETNQFETVEDIILTFF